MFVSNASSAGGYQIARSVRMRSSAPGYFSRTPSVAGNLQTVTWSGWVKKSSQAVAQRVFGATTSNTQGFLLFQSTDTLMISEVNGTTVQFKLETVQLFRDPNAWYHIVFILDTTNATLGERLRLYVNGSRVTAFSTAVYPPQNYSSLSINTVNPHFIGNSVNSLDGNIADVTFIDGTAYGPSSFGKTDSITGVWSPIKYSGSYGTNGFFLNFNDNSASTAAAIGRDTSPNGNNYTPTNISVTSGSTYDSALDTPLGSGGADRGNYCSLNAISPNPGNKLSPVDGNLTLLMSTGTNAYFGCPGSFVMTSGKWYWECLMGAKDSAAGQWYQLGIISSDIVWPSGTNIGGNIGGYCYINDGTLGTAGGGSPAVSGTYGAVFTTGDVIGIAFDADNGTLLFYKNGVSQGTAFTAITNISSGFVPAFEIYRSAGTVQTMFPNFGQRPYSYLAPAGFRSLHTGSIVAPTIKKSNLFFDATTYSGTGVARSVVNGGLQSDLLWIKNRNGSTNYSNQLQDSSRGAARQLFSDSSAVEVASTTMVTSFNSNGFSVSTSPQVNGNANSLVAWQWKKGAATGFDIVVYTGTGANATVPHALGAAPKLILVKAVSPTIRDWRTYHSNLTSSAYALSLNLNVAEQLDATSWNSTAPTSTVFSVGTSLLTNASSGTFISYLFAEIPGFSRIGKYTGNGLVDGPFVNCGFRPRWLLTKRADAASSWWLQDTMRSQTNPMNALLFAELAGLEYTTAGVECDFLSNGFKPRHTNAGGNASGGRYIFMAFAENPFKYALAR